MPRTAPLGLDGLEYYSGMLELADPARWADARRTVEERGLVIPMLCCSPDFSHPDAEFRRVEIEKEKHWIRMAAALGAAALAGGLALAGLRPLAWMALLLQPCRHRGNANSCGVSTRVAIWREALANASRSSTATAR